MNTSSLAQLQQFISANKIGRTNGILLFEAVIHFVKDNNPHTIHSAVQIVTLPEASVVYIIEFFKPEYEQNEMYSTAEYELTCIDDNILQVTNDAAATKINISLQTGSKNSLAFV